MENINTTVNLTATELSTLSVKELRKLANEQGLGSGGWRATATKDALVTALSTGEVPASPSNSAASAATLADAIERVISSVTPSLDEDRVRELIAEIVPTIDSNRPKEIEVIRLDTSKVNVGRQHYLFAELLQWAALRIPVMLVGPAGSGKSTAAEFIAKALTLEFYPMSVTNQTSKSDLLGYKDANGNYHPSIFRRAFEFGGVFNLDEVDKGNANVLAVLNAATSNGYCSFPDAVIKAHPDFIMIAAGNTFGLGRNAQFVGSNQLDAATLNRFATLSWGYDESLENEITAPFGQQDWVRFVQKVRSVVDTLGIRHIVSPRASIQGSQALAAGLDRTTVESAVLWKGLDAASVQKVRENLVLA